MNESITLVLNDKLIEKIMNDYQMYQQTTNNPYITFFAKTNDLTISIYTSKKVLFQGINATLVASHYQPITKSQQSSENNSCSSSIILPQAGSDEVGTGDVFGPVVVVASYIDKSIYSKIKELKIMDSKVLNDETILKIAPKLMNEVIYSCLVLDNKKYNEVHQKYNLNGLKAILHNSAYVHLKNKLNGSLPSVCMVDQFTPKNNYYSHLKDQTNIITNLSFETKAESKYIAVAVSSMIARYLFIQAMDQLSENIGFTLHKGAGKLVDQDIERIINEKGKEYLPFVAKCHFSNIQKGINHA